MKLCRLTGAALSPSIHTFYENNCTRHGTIQKCNYFGQNICNSRHYPDYDHNMRKTPKTALTAGINVSYIFLRNKYSYSILKWTDIVLGEKQTYISYIR